MYKKVTKKEINNQWNVAVSFVTKENCNLQDDDTKWNNSNNM